MKKKKIKTFAEEIGRTSPVKSDTRLTHAFRKALLGVGPVQLTDGELTVRIVDVENSDRYYVTVEILICDVKTGIALTEVTRQVMGIGDKLHLIDLRNAWKINVL